MIIQFESGRALVTRRGDLWISRALITGIAADQRPQLKGNTLVVPVYCGGFFRREPSGTVPQEPR